MPHPRVRRPAAWLCGTGLVSALGADPVAAVRSSPVLPTRVDLGTTGGCVPYFAIKGERSHGRLEGLVALAVEQALGEAGLSTGERARAMVLVGTSSLDLGHWEALYRQTLDRDGLGTGDDSAFVALGSRHGSYGTLAALAATLVGSRGPRYLISTACSSSANALLQGLRAIRGGLVRHALVLGVEVYNQLTLHGFNSLALLSRGRLRPFDARRDGTILGEAVAAVVLSADPVSRFRLLGGYSEADTVSFTGTHPPAVARVIERTLAAGATPAGGLTAIKAHGTGTGANDAAEAQGMRLLFGGSVPPFSSLKPWLGHTLGACGAAELVLLCRCLAAGFFPAVPTVTQIDPELGVAPEARHLPVSGGRFLLDFFGFGGNSCGLMLECG